MKMIIDKPKNLPEETIESVYKLICNHSTIYLEGLKGRIQKAAFISIFKEKGEIIATRSIKTPIIEYKKTIFYNAGIGDRHSHFKYETGWSATLPKFRCRGLSNLLLKGLLSKIDNTVYSTTRVNNIAPQKILRKNGFFQAGNKFSGMEEPIILWLYNNQTEKWRILGWL